MGGLRERMVDVGGRRLNVVEGGISSRLSSPIWSPTRSLPSWRAIRVPHSRWRGGYGFLATTTQ